MASRTERTQRLCVDLPVSTIALLEAQANDYDATVGKTISDALRLRDILRMYCKEGVLVLQKPQDFLDEIVEERTKKNPDFPKKVEDARTRREIARVNRVRKIQGLKPRPTTDSLLVPVMDALVANPTRYIKILRGALSACGKGTPVLLHWGLTYLYAALLTAFVDARPTCGRLWDVQKKLESHPQEAARYAGEVLKRALLKNTPKNERRRRQALNPKR